MLPEDEWDKQPDVVSVLKPMIMGHLNGTGDAYTAKQMIENMGLLEDEMFRKIEDTDVLEGVKATLRALEEDGTLQSKRVQIGSVIEWFYRPIPQTVS